MRFSLIAKTVRPAAWGGGGTHTRVLSTCRITLSYRPVSRNLFPTLAMTYMHVCYLYTSRFAARNVLRISEIMVIGPTPPGTGVI